MRSSWILSIALGCATSSATPAGPGCIADACEDPAAAPAAGANVDGEPLASCSTDPLTGWFRDGHCRTDAADRGLHTVCAVMTEGFLDYTRGQGNDLSTARGSFPGLRPGDRWCLCAARWEEARQAGHAPAVLLEATHRKALTIVERAALEAHAVEAGPSGVVSPRRP